MGKEEEILLIGGLAILAFTFVKQAGAKAGEALSSGINKVADKFSNINLNPFHSKEVAELKVENFKQERRATNAENTIALMQDKTIGQKETFDRFPIVEEISTTGKASVTFQGNVTAEELQKKYSNIKIKGSDKNLKSSSQETPTKLNSTPVRGSSSSSKKSKTSSKSLKSGESYKGVTRTGGKSVTVKTGNFGKSSTGNTIRKKIVIS
jgi:hypothetical protein